MSEGIVTAKQINYHQDMYSHPSYQFQPQYPNTFGQPISLGAAQIPIQITIPPEVYNLAQSFLNYDMNLNQAAAAGSFVWMFMQALSAISNIQLVSGSGQFLVNLDHLQNYLDVVLKRELSYDEFQAMDSRCYNTLSLSCFCKRGWCICCGIFPR